MKKIRESLHPVLGDASGSAISAGFLAVIVSYAGPLLVYLQAADAMRVSPDQVSSWVFAISIAAGLSSIWLSVWLRVPIAMAWSAPGTVLLIALGQDISTTEMVGAYVMVALVLFLIGISGIFEWLVRLLPQSVTNGMTAGILFGFGLSAARGLASDPVVISVLLLAFVICSALVPRYTMLLLLSVALLLSSFAYEANIASVSLQFAQPMLLLPELSVLSMLSLALPLLITTLSGQYLPGMAILRANGYQTSANPILVVGAVSSVGAAMFGGITTALASITGAFCAGRDAHPDPARRYVAGVACGVFFCLGGLFSGSIIQTLISLPSSVIALLAGLALLQPILKFIEGMMASSDRQAGLLSFLFTASGVTLFGMSAAFWGVVVGCAAHFLTLGISRWRDRRAG